MSRTLEEKYLSTKRELSDVLTIFGVTPEKLKEISENESDQVPFSTPVNNITVRESRIHGKGIFAIESIEANKIIAPARIAGKRTPVGRFTNHSSRPNAKMFMRKNGDVYLISTEPIKAGYEILTDYFYNYINTRSLR